MNQTSIDPVSSIALLSRIFETDRLNIFFNEKRGLFEIPIFENIESPCFTKLEGYGFRVYDIVRSLKITQSLNADCILRVEKRK